MIDGIGSSGGALSGLSGLNSAASDARFASMTGRAGAVRGLLNGPVARHTEVVPGESDDPTAAIPSLTAQDGTRQYGEVNGIRYVRSAEESARLYENARTPEQKKVKETADQFVSILYSMLFKQLDATVQKSGLIDGGQTEKMFQSFVLDEYAKTAATQNSNNPVSHRIYEMLYESTAARRPAASAGAAPAAGVAPTATGSTTSSGSPAASPAASSFSTNG